MKLSYFKSVCEFLYEQKLERKERFTWSLCWHCFSRFIASL